MRNLEDAEPLIRELLTRSEFLHGQDPEAASVRFNRAVAHQHAANLKGRLLRTDKALQHARKAYELLRTLLNQSPHDIVYADYYLGSCRALYSVLAKQGRPEEGRVFLKEACESSEALLAQGAKDGTHLFRTATRYYIYGAVSAEQGFLEEALAAYRGGLAALERVPAAASDTCRVARVQARLHINAARVFYRREDHTSAEHHARKALEVLQRGLSLTDASGEDHAQMARLLLQSPVPSLRDPVAALQQAQIAAKLSPEYRYNVATVLALAHCANGERDRCVEILEELQVSIGPTEDSLNRMIAERLQRHEEGAQVCEVRSY
jgi:tetratricopeptide (TPR) repeat protein